MPLLLQVLLGLMWLFLIALLVRFVRPSSKIKNWSTVGLIASASLALLVGAILIFHPGPSLKGIQSDAVFVSQGTTEMRTEPSAGGSSIVSVEPTTACRILAERGEWTYLELLDSTRGWVESSAIEKI